MIDLLCGGIQTPATDDDTPLENTLTSQDLEQEAVDGWSSFIYLNSNEICL